MHFTQYYEKIILKNKNNEMNCYTRHDIKCLNTCYILLLCHFATMTPLYFVPFKKLYYTQLFKCGFFFPYFNLLMPYKRKDIVRVTPVI